MLHQSKKSRTRQGPAFFYARSRIHRGAAAQAGSSVSILDNRLECFTADIYLQVAICNGDRPVYGAIQSG